MNVKPWIKPGLIAFAGYLFFLIWTLPAHIVVDNVKMPKNFALGNATGTIWSGKVDGAVVQGVVLKDLEWSFSPLSLFTGKFGADIEFGNKRNDKLFTGDGFVYIGIMDTGVADFNLAIPSHFIEDKIDNQYIEGFSGAVSLAIEEFTVGKPYCSTLVGKAFWQQSSLNVMGSDLALGDLSVDLACNKGGIAAKIKGDGKVLDLNADVTLMSKNKILLDGNIKTGAKADAVVTNTLTVLGKKDDKGYHTLHFKN